MVCCKHKRKNPFYTTKGEHIMDRMKLIAALVVLCLASSVAAFLLPTAHGTLLSYVSIASAAVIAVLAVISLVRMLMQRRAF